MGIALVKATWIFEGQARGWTESLYKLWNTVDPSTVPDLRIAWAEALVVAQKRALMLGKEYKIKAIRVSTEVDAVGTRVIGDALTDYVNIVGNQQQPGLAPNMAVQSIFRSGNAQKRKFTDVRGGWLSLLGDGGILIAVPEWVSAFNGWASYLAARAYGWQGDAVILKDAVVSGYTQNLPADTVTFTYQASVVPPLIAGRQYYVRNKRINGRSELNTRMLVTLDDATHATTVFKYGVVPFTSNGLTTFYTRVLITPENWNIQKIMSRRAGAPLLEPRGRRPVRVRT